MNNAPEISPFYEKKIKCIHCNHTFTSYKVRTKFIKIAETESDFHPIYSDSNVNALYYNVFVCEHCGFSFTEDFTTYFAPGIKELINEQICSKWVPRSFNGERTLEQAIQAYQLAFVSGTLKKERHVTLAGLALRIGWLYRSSGNEEQERRFIKLARDQYLDSFSTDDYSGTQMTSTRVIYMIGELSRRIGDYDMATKFFSKVIEKQHRGDAEIKLVKMAKDQWELVRAAKEELGLE